MRRVTVAVLIVAACFARGSLAQEIVISPGRLMTAEEVRQENEQRRQERLRVLEDTVRNLKQPLIGKDGEPIIDCTAPVTARSCVVVDDARNRKHLKGVESLDKGTARGWCEWAVEYNRKDVDARECESNRQCHRERDRAVAKAMKRCLQEYRQGARRPGF
jgi:hypothetical protein